MEGKQKQKSFQILVGLLRANIFQSATMILKIQSLPTRSSMIPTREFTVTWSLMILNQPLRLGVGTRTQHTIFHALVRSNKCSSNNMLIKLERSFKRRMKSTLDPLNREDLTLGSAVNLLRKTCQSTLLAKRS